MELRRRSSTHPATRWRKIDPMIVRFISRLFAMPPRFPHRQMLLCVLLLALSGAGLRGAPPVARPNIVVILVADLRWEEMGCAGHPVVKTPHIDRIAREGARFTNSIFRPCSSKAGLSRATSSGVTKASSATPSAAAIGNTPASRARRCSSTCDDLAEATNLAAQHPGKLRELQEAHAAVVETLPK